MLCVGLGGDVNSACDEVGEAGTWKLAKKPGGTSAPPIGASCQNQISARNTASDPFKRAIDVGQSGLARVYNSFTHG